MEKPQSKDFTEEEVTKLQGLLGGKEKYGSVMRWARATLNKAFVDRFDEAMEEADFDRASAVIEELGRKFETALAADPEGTAQKAEPARQISDFEERLWALIQEFKDSASTRNYTDAMKMMLVVTKMEHEGAVEWLEENPQVDQNIDLWKEDIVKLKAAMTLLRDI